MRYDINERLQEYYVIGTCINSALEKLKVNFIELNKDEYNFNEDDIYIDLYNKDILINSVVSDGVNKYPAFFNIMKLEYIPEKFYYKMIISTSYEKLCTANLISDFMEHIECIYECVNNINMKKFEKIEESL